VFGSYAILVLILILNYYKTIFKTDYLLLGMAFFFFGLSVLLDLLDISGINPYVYEDGAKLFGIISWSFYFYYSAKRIVSNQFT